MKNATVSENSSKNRESRRTAAGRAGITIREVVDRILAYHPALDSYHGCDDYKCGDPDAVCTGVVTTMSATVSIVRQAAKLGANLIVVHEPTNYTSADLPGWRGGFSNHVFDEKMKLIRDHGITIWRDHDHMHAHCPDSIFTGVLRYMGWEPYTVANTGMKPFGHYLVTLPETILLGDLIRRLKDTIGLNGVRYIGREEMAVRRLAIVGHLYPIPYPGKNADGTEKEYSTEVIRCFEEQGADVILPGETVDWTVLSYIRDAVQLGENKAAIILGHYNWEELGMRYAREWLQELLGDTVRVFYLFGGDMYRYE